MLPANIRKLVYNSLVKSHIEYGIIAYGGVEKRKLDRIRSLQKRAIRIVALKHKISHTNPTFGKLEILKFDDLYRLNSGIFMHKFILHKLPSSFRDMFKAFPEPNRTRSLILEQTKYKALDSFPKVCLQKTWNSLSIELKYTIMLTKFKSIFKSEIFTEYNSFSCQDPNCYSCSN